MQSLYLFRNLFRVSSHHRLVTTPRLRSASGCAYKCKMARLKCIFRFVACFQPICACVGMATAELPGKLANLSVAEDTPGGRVPSEFPSGHVKLPPLREASRAPRSPQRQSQSLAPSPHPPAVPRSSFCPARFKGFNRLENHSLNLALEGFSVPRPEQRLVVHLTSVEIVAKTVVYRIAKHGTTVRNHRARTQCQRTHRRRDSRTYSPSPHRRRNSRTYGQLSSCRTAFRFRPDLLNFENPLSLARQALLGTASTFRRARRGWKRRQIAESRTAGAASHRHEGGRVWRNGRGDRGGRLGGAHRGRQGCEEGCRGEISVARTRSRDPSRTRRHGGNEIWIKGRANARGGCGTTTRGGEGEGS